MNVQTGQWRCFYGVKSGNSYDLIRELHAIYFSTTTDEQYASLIKMRKGAIDLPVLKEMQVAWNPVTSEWLLPSWGTEGASKGIVNLYTYKKSFDTTTGQASMQVLSGPTFKHVPYGIHRLRQGTNRPIWVLEGHFDYLAFNSLLRRIEPSQQPNYDSVGAPGSGTFPRIFLNIFSGRDVVLVYDNDQAGQEGMEKITRDMSGQGIFPMSLRHMVWPEGLPKGFDVSDVITHLPKALIPRKKKA
jgi:hypothetical protein